MAVQTQAIDVVTSLEATMPSGLGRGKQASTTLRDFRKYAFFTRARARAHAPPFGAYF
jgi:hypothetical protein